MAALRKVAILGWEIGSVLIIDTELRTYPRDETDTSNYDRIHASFDFISQMLTNAVIRIQKYHSFVSG